MLLTLETLPELFTGYNPLNDSERFNHIYDFVESIFEMGMRTTLSRLVYF